MSSNWNFGPVTLASLFAMALAAFGEVREEFHQAYPLAEHGQVSLENVNGNVRVIAWDRTEIKVDAVKRARTQRHLDEVELQVKAAADKIQIKTKYPNGKNNSTTVEYTLTVPRESRLNKISTVNGGVQIEGVRGEVEANSVNGQVTGSGLAGKTRLSTINGSVRATLVELHESLSLESVNGSVTAALPANVNADISAKSQNGGLSSDFPLQVKRHFPIGQTLEGKLGNGGPQVKLSALNGGVHLDRAATVSAEEAR